MERSKGAYQNYRWVDEKLYYNNRNTGIFLSPHESIKDHYWIEWTKPERGKSMNFYNLSNACDNSRLLDMRREGSI